MSAAQLHEGALLESQGKQRATAKVYRSVLKAIVPATSVPAARRGLIALAVAALLGTVAARAADAVHPELLACAGVKKNSERLACYDQAIGRLSSNSAAAAPARSAEAMFGASAAPGQAPSPAIEREELMSLSARV